MRSTFGGWCSDAGATSVVAATALVTLVACGGGAASSSSAGSPGGTCQGSSGDASATTRSYVIVLDVGEPEVMYSQQEAQASHPKSGEIMLGGTMADVSGPNVRHVEAHVCARSNGSVVTGAQPVITIADTTAGTPGQDLPVAEMQGVGQGVSDYHYGNNAVLTPGHMFAITVRLHGETAVLHYKAK